MSVRDSMFQYLFNALDVDRSNSVNFKVPAGPPTRNIDPDSGPPTRIPPWAPSRAPTAAPGPPGAQMRSKWASPPGPVRVDRPGPDPVGPSIL